VNFYHFAEYVAIRKSVSKSLTRSAIESLKLRKRASNGKGIQLKSLSLNGHIWEHPEATLLNKSRRNLLGVPFFKQFTMVVFDNPNQRLVCTLKRQ
jgi:hypothetical protein